MAHTVAVITPTIGSPDLVQCVQSVAKQDCTHYLFVDGHAYLQSVIDLIAPYQHENLVISFLGRNIGKGWYGHRVYAAAAPLVNEEVLCYLDEDNWYAPNHIETIQQTFAHPHNQWCYALRSIYTKSGVWLCDDNCESLGHWPVVGEDPRRYHIDTACFAVSRQAALNVGHTWYGTWGADRQFFGVLKSCYPQFACTMHRTVNYRLDGNSQSVTGQFFEERNLIAKTHYPTEFPWCEQPSNIE